MFGQFHRRLRRPCSRSSVPPTAVATPSPPPPLMLVALAIVQLCHTYTHRVGYLSGSAIIKNLTRQHVTLKEAEAVCSREAACRGFCFAGEDPAPALIGTAFFMNQSTVGYAALYQTYIRDYVPVHRYPGPLHLTPTLHFSPACVSSTLGWHDVAGAITHHGVHHIFQGVGWNHAFSRDLVNWHTGAHGPLAIKETYKGMASEDEPCSGFLTKDDDGTVCAGFRQCSSTRGVAGSVHPWDVPLELRCATNASLSEWAEPEYLFNVSFYRAVPYDPARPWREPSDGFWYVMLAFDGCNSTSQKLPCAAGGQLVLWRSPELRGPRADWRYVGPVFTSNATVLRTARLTKEFVTIDFIGRLDGDVSNASSGTRVFLNNVGGNGGGDGCCAGTTSYFALEQKAPGGPLVQVAPQGMVDWGSFRLRREAIGSGGSSARGVDLLDGTASRGLSMARTLGSEAADMVSCPGRRVLIGWTGPADAPIFEGAASTQSLPRQLSLAPDRSLRQAFVPELATLRRAPKSAHGAAAWSPLHVGLHAEVLATLPPACAAPEADCGVTLLGDGSNATRVTLSPSLGLVLVDATAQGNSAVRAGPLPAAGRDGWTIHAYLDASIIELIVNNETALIVYAAPSPKGGQVALTGTLSANGSGAALVVWPLEPPQHTYREDAVCH